MPEETTRRTSKNSVFVTLFEDKKYVLQLYKELHPEDKDVTVDDIDIQTIESVLVNTLYNDLGFVVKDKFIVLVEAQSSWNENLTLRILFYLAETYRRYINKNELSEHSRSRIALPKPDLYVVYSGNKDVPEVVSFSEDYFGGDSPVDLRVKVFKQANETICGQYISFCKVFDEQRNIYDNSIECAKETLRVCVEKGYLAEFLRNHEQEVITMMSELFDEEYLRKQYEIAEEKKNIEKGIIKGRAEGKAEGRAEGKTEERERIISNLRKMGLSESQIKQATGMI